MAAAAGLGTCTEQAALKRAAKVPTARRVASSVPDPLRYLSAYPPDLQAQVAGLIAGSGLGVHLRRRYPVAHTVRNDRSLFQYVTDLKNEYLRGADGVDKVLFDSKIQVIRHAAAIVRVGAPHPELIARSLDWGAAGIMVPMVEDEAQARDAY